MTVDQYREDSITKGALLLFTGSSTELMGDIDCAINFKEPALQHNQWSIHVINAMSCKLRARKQFPMAIKYLFLLLVK